MKKSKLSAFLVSISYDGSSFFGWAKQVNRISVQETVERKLSLLFRQSVRILSSSRTDKGVHALDQRFSFKILTKIPSEKVVKIVKESFQRSQLVVSHVEEVDLQFHPINDVFRKEYIYKINTGPFKQFSDKYLWNYNKKINLSSLREILSNFVGTHDFFNFCFCKVSDRLNTNTIRTIDRISVFQNSEIVSIKFISSGFLRYQIRAIIGDSIRILESRIKSFSKIQERLKSGSQDKYKKIAPPSGLYLSKVVFK